MTQVRTSPSHNGRYNRNDRKKVLEYLQRSNMLTMTQVAKQYNLSPSTVHHWVHRYLPKEKANTIVQRGHNIRGVQISNTRSKKQLNQRIFGRSLPRDTPKQSPKQASKLHELHSILAHLEDVKGEVKNLIGKYSGEK
jgi:transposase